MPSFISKLSSSPPAAEICFSCRNRVANCFSRARSSSCSRATNTRGDVTRCQVASSIGDLRRIRPLRHCLRPNMGLAGDRSGPRFQSDLWLGVLRGIEQCALQSAYLIRLIEFNTFYLYKAPRDLVARQADFFRILMRHPDVVG